MICFYLFYSNLTLAEILEELENVILSDASDEEILQERPVFKTKSSEVTVNILPPDNNEGGTDEDCGDEEEVRVSNLPGSQLRAKASADSTSVSIDEADKTETNQRNKKKSRQWVDNDLKENNEPFQAF